MFGKSPLCAITTVDRLFNRIKFMFYVPILELLFQTKGENATTKK